MSDPEALHEAGRRHQTKLRTLIHGDLWHNNVFFRHANSSPAAASSSSPKLLLTDWQMSHIGISANDLCFLLFSSTSPRYRQENWDSTVRHYYDCFVQTLRTLNVSESELDVSFDEFLLDVKASIPISLFFCGNIQDLDTSDETSVEARMASVTHSECDSPYATIHGSDEETLRYSHGSSLHDSSFETPAGSCSPASATSMGSGTTTSTSC